MESFFQKALLNSKITEVNRICDLVRFVFELEDGQKINLHEQCLLRIFDASGILVVSSPNMSDRSPNYQKKWFKKYDWTEIGATIFDDALKECKSELLSTKVTDIKFENNDIRFKFANGMRMDILTITTKYDDVDYSENYRIFYDDKSKEHYIV